MGILIARTCSFSLIVSLALSLYGCNDVSKAPAPPPGPSALAILTTSPLPDAAVSQPYNVALAASGGTPGYTWSLTANSPRLPAGLSLSTTGIISGTPTSTTPPGAPVNLIIQAVDSGSAAQGSQQTSTKTLSITVNPAPVPLQIVTSSLPQGSINAAYFAALSGNGGTTPYTWGLQSGSPALPPGLSLDSANGFIQGTPTQTANQTLTITLQDAKLAVVQKPLTLLISAVPLSITTASPLPQATANQNYSTSLAAKGGTGTLTWSSSSLPAGLSLNPSTGVLSGIPSVTGTFSPTFTVTDQTLPIPQSLSKILQLVVGAAPPPLSISTNSPLPPGTQTVAYSVTLNSSGGIGTKAWDIQTGSLPAGLNLSSSGVITGTPATTGTTSPTFRVRDSGSPQQTATKQLSITISKPAPPNITTTSLPNGAFNQPYNQTIQVSGGVPPLFWGVISGALPPGLGLNASTGQISGTASQTGTFNFTTQITDAIPQSDTQALSITITAPTPPQITTSSLPKGTVTQAYPSTTLQASGGTAPLIWDPVVQPALPNGLSWNAGSHTIAGTPQNGSQGTTSHTFTVSDSTNPAQVATRTLSLTINLPAPPNITSTSASLLPNGIVTHPYSRTLQVSGGTGTLMWKIQSGSLPDGIALNPSTGVISGTPTKAGSFNFTPQVTDSLNQTDPTPPPLSITVVLPPPPNITTTSLPKGTIGTAYNQTVQVSGGTGSISWSLSSGSLPTGLNPINPSTGLISGTPLEAGRFDFTVRATDDTLQFDDQPLSITIDLPAPPKITTSALSDGTAGQAYNQQVQADGGFGNLTWGISAGALPPGLEIDSMTGVISGEPTEAGKFDFTVQVTDTIPQSDAKPLSITIN